MNDENGFLVIQYENDLKEPPAVAPTPDQPLILFDPSRVRTRCLANHLFRFLWRYAMLAMCSTFQSFQRNSMDLLSLETGGRSTRNVPT
jgi:hypothetical protein